jgi:hypothetical protein
MNECNQNSDYSYCGKLYCGENFKKQIKDKFNLVKRHDLDKLRNCKQPAHNWGFICVNGKCPKNKVYYKEKNIPFGSHVLRLCHAHPIFTKEECCLGKYDLSVHCPKGFCRGSTKCIKFLKDNCNKPNYRNRKECKRLNYGCYIVNEENIFNDSNKTNICFNPLINSVEEKKRKFRQPLNINKYKSFSFFYSIIKVGAIISIILTVVISITTLIL